MTVNSLWIGNSFSLLEMLTMKSFIDNGMLFKLWVYNKNLEHYVPQGVQVCDANEIIEESRVFTYKGGGDCREGSVGGFSDLFRYYLLLKQGGIYVDMDVTCLEPFNFDSDYAFRPHSHVFAVANVLKAPKDSAFLKRCIELTEKEVDRNNITWVKPVQIFSDVIKEFNLEKHVLPYEYFGNDSSEDVLCYKTKNFFLHRAKLPKYGIHWCRECSYGTWSFEHVYDWNFPKPLTFYYNLLLKHKLIK